MLDNVTWAKLDTSVKIVATIVGLCFTIIYQCSQNKLSEVQQEATKAQLQSNIITLIKGDEMERSLAIKFALAFADKFNDDRFSKIVIRNFSTNDESPRIREEAKIEIIKSAENFYKFGAFPQCVKQYEEAIQFIPSDQLDPQLLKEAKKASEELDSKEACNLYRKLFLSLSLK